jgi:O-antigen/teichoic acid export membrane protein
MRRTVINLVSVVGGEALLRAANFLAVVVIARLYGAGTLGLYATLLAYATVAVMIAENGLQISSIIEIGRSPKDINAVASSICALRAVLFALMSALLAVIGWWEKWPTEVWTIGALITFRVLLYSYSQLQFSILKSINRMPAIGPIQAANFAVLLIGIAATYRYSWGLTWLLWCFIISQTFEIALSLRFLWRAGIRPERFHLQEWWDFLRRSTPVGLAYVLMGLTMRADVIVLSAFGSSSDVGRFAAAHMGIVLLYSMSWLFGSVLLPDFTRLREDPDAVERYVSHWTKFLLLTAGFGAIAVSWVARPIILALYGKEFAVTGDLATVMVLAVPFILLNAVYLSRAMSLGSARAYLTTYAATTTLAVVLDISMVRIYGAMGIAFAIVIRELATFLIFRIRATSIAPSELRPQPIYEPVEMLDI